MQENYKKEKEKNTHWTKSTHFIWELEKQHYQSSINTHISLIKPPHVNSRQSIQEPFFIYKNKIKKKVQNPNANQQQTHQIKIAIGSTKVKETKKQDYYKLARASESSKGPHGTY